MPLSPLMSHPGRVVREGPDFGCLRIDRERGTDEARNRFGARLVDSPDATWSLYDFDQVDRIVDEDLGQLRGLT